MIEELIECAQEIRTPIQIEITEHAYVDALDKMLQSVSRLRLAGIRVAIDDFGAGYSSLTSLTQLEADEVKLDREFILTWMKRPQQT
jgi:EAL domain-containing protein (putative c-di-GMP-specific phosphodiesterase class I)